MKQQNYMLLEFPNRSFNESFACSAVSSFVSQLDPTHDELMDIRTSVAEAVNNSIHHAYPNSIGIITIRCRILKDDVLDVVIKDKGVGIADVSQAMRPMFTTGGGEHCGMGFTIMESMMTNLDVKSVPGKGTTVHMKRRIISRKSYNSK